MRGVVLSCCLFLAVAFVAVNTAAEYILVEVDETKAANGSGKEEEDFIVPSEDARGTFSCEYLVGLG